MRRFTTIVKALSDENRARIVMALRQGELCACEIIEMLGLSPSTVSKHISILLQAELIDCRKDGRWHYYRLAQAAPGVESTHEWMATLLGNEKQVALDRRQLKKICRKYSKPLTKCC